MDDVTTDGTGTFQNSRAPFEPLGFGAAPNDALVGTQNADSIRGDVPDGPGSDLPGAIAFWEFDNGIGGVFSDTRGGPGASTYLLADNTAAPNLTPVTRAGPDGTANSALEFNGEDTFAFIEHDSSMEVTQGTVSLWMQPDELSKHQQIVLSKDESGADNGGHFRLGHEDNGRLFLRFAEGDGGSNKAWISSEAYLTEGQWTHVAVSYTDDGITVYVDGVAVPDYAWYRQEGNLDSPSQATEAYLLQNQEPWILGADTSHTENNDSPEAFAAVTNSLDDAFDGAIADFGFWGGFTPDAALDAGQVWNLFNNGPGTALTAPAGPQPILAGNDIIQAGDGNDTVDGNGGDDELFGQGGHDELNGGYGDDILDGGDGDDVLLGGRGSDLLLGGAGDDLLVSRSDAGEQRIGQLAIGQPTREDPDNEVNNDRQKLYGWEDQPLIGDDIMVGGEGRDTFLFNPQINAKRDIILEHVNDDRTIDWAAVAGENNELHDHWVDSFGIDIIADYRADEDTIAIIGHTATPEVEHKLIDTDGDGINDEAVSVISVYSNQGNGGGAHTQDLLGQIVVHGDLVDADDIVNETKVTHGIVDTVDDIQEALAPTGDLKTSLLSDGTTVIGYDTRDANGNLGEVIENPELFSDNPFLNSGRFEFASNVPDDVPAPVAVIDELSHPVLDEMVFTGNQADGQGSLDNPGAYVNIPHAGRASSLAQTAGTIAFSFVADAPGAGKQVLFSKDASGYVDGGHLTAWIDDHGCVDVRYQSTNQSLYFKADGIEHLEAGVAYDFAFSFDSDSAELYLNGQLQAAKDLSDNPEFASGMLGNSESLVFGASTMNRTSGTLNDLRYFFDGSISDVVIADRALSPVEIFKLVDADGDFSSIGLDSTNPLNTPVDEGLAQATSTADETIASTSVVTEFAETDGTLNADTLNGTSNNDIINALDGDDIVTGDAGHDTIFGGYGDDQLDGGAGNDILMGGRGSDLLRGGDGDDLLISRSDSGEQRIGQLAVGNPTRPDPDNEVNPDRQKLYGWEGQPLIGDDVLIGGAGNDTFLISPQINAKLDIINEHVLSDNSIKWSAVAHENDELHDHWVDSSGIDIIADYNSSEDHIAIIGHTANIEIEHRDVDGDGDNESIISIYSNQANGGAHTQDLIGQAIVFGDEVDAEDVVTDAGVTFGIVETIGEIDEAISPTGDLKTSVGPDGEIILGYDTRDANGGLGPIVDNPFEYSDNPFLNDVSFGAPSTQESQNSRADFVPLGFQSAENDVVVGTSGADELHGDPQSPQGPGLPGALAFWTFGNGVDGVFANERSGSDVLAYRLYENQSLLQTEMPLRAGPDGTANGALEFNGEDTFAFIEHDSSMEVTQGTVSLWMQPDELSKHQQIVLSKDESGADNGGHFRLGHEDNGRLFLRFAEGDGGSNKAWISSEAYLTEGQWTHVAVSYTDDGITVYVDGVAVPDYAWYRQEGNLDSPSQATEAYLLQNQEPWILGADTSRTEHNDTAAEFATDDEHLCDAFDGAIADFGFWGGFTPDAALDAGQVWNLFNNGPGTALTAPAGPQPILAGNDIIQAGDGNDTVDGNGGDDELFGQGGHDELNGGYGDDILDGGDGDDVLLGGRGSDLLLGGAGDDLLVSRSDAGEQRIGQLAIGQPTREDPDNEVNNDRQKLYGWEDQPLIGDDIMVGGEGRDTFLFNPQINAKRDIILEHVNDDRTIDWAAVAGENNELHDHWVDSFGIDIIADYRADEDTIAIIGHTATPEVEHKLIDTDGDGINDEAVSVISVYSNQGNGGGAHTQDLLGQIVVHGDLVDADDIVNETKVTHGIVDTVDDIQEALAPTGDLKTSLLSDGTTVIGYDTRDANGNLGEVIENPELFSDNPFLNSGRFEFASNVPDDVPAPVAVIDELSHPVLDEMVFTGNQADGQGSLDNPGAYVNIPHAGRASSLAQTAGTIAFSFVADAPGAGKQVLFSKDASGYVDGGHLTAWIDDHGCVDVRYQSTNQSLYFKADGIEHLEAGVAYDFAFSFDSDSAELYLNGQLQAAKDLSDNPEFASGMLGNSESLVFGASTMNRTSGTLNDLRYFFDGSISDVVILDRALHPVEAFKLAADQLVYITTDGPVVDETPVDETPVDETPVDETPVDETPVDETPVDETPVDETPVDETPVDETPVDETPVDETPVDETPVDETPVDETPADGTPVDEAPVDETPVDETPVDETPVDETPVDETPVDETPVDETPVDETPVDETPVDETPVDEAPVDEAPVDDDITLKGTTGGDELIGASGSDELIGLGGDDILDGLAGDDYLNGGRGDDAIDGGAGNDEIIAGRGADEVDGSDGDDSISGGWGDDSLVGGDGDDSIVAGSGDDEVEGGNGDDVLSGGRGDDSITGDAGDDEIFGSRGDDDIEGGSGNDLLVGGAGNDSLTGGSGDDDISAGRGDDNVDGGSGNDVITGGRGNDNLVGGLDDDAITGGRGDDELHGDGGADNLDGQLGDDVLFGGDDDDKLIGGRGSDVLLGEDGNDIIKGGAGDDVLIGGQGNDDLSGSRGDDVFLYQSNEGESLGFDVIRDFRSGQDTLMVSDDLTLLFDDEVGFTRITLTDSDESIVGTIDILGNSFDAQSDVNQVSNQNLNAIDDLFV